MSDPTTNESDETLKPGETPAVPEIAKGGHPLDLPRPRTRLLLWITLAILVATIVGSAIYGHLRWKQWETEWSKLGPIDATGGLYFPTRVVLNVPLFRQSDARWRKDQLGTGKTSVSAEGCAVSSAAMVLAAYGVDTDPGRLNAALTESEGFENHNRIIWEKAAEVTGNIARKAYEDQPSFRLIDEQLQHGNPVIVRLRTSSGGTHFVVIAGKEGYDYLTLDPGAGGSKGLYPLKEYGSKIEALRFYEVVKK
jgi:hypothetical protein